MFYIGFDRKILKGNGKEEYGLDFAKYLIKDGIFNEIALDVKKDLENYKFKLSRYNSNLIVEKCEVCQCKVNLETHHIEFQKDSNFCLTYISSINSNLNVILFFNGIFD